VIKMADQVEEINVVHKSELSEFAQTEIAEKVSNKPQSFNFKGFVEVRMVTASPMRVEIEPIEGTDIDWFKKNSTGSEIDISSIF